MESTYCVILSYGDKPIRVVFVHNDQFVAFEFMKNAAITLVYDEVGKNNFSPKTLDDPKHVSQYGTGYVLKYENTNGYLKRINVFQNKKNGDKSVMPITTKLMGYYAIVAAENSQRTCCELQRTQQIDVIARAYNVEFPAASGNSTVASGKHNLCSADKPCNVDPLINVMGLTRPKNVEKSDGYVNNLIKKISNDSLQDEKNYVSASDEKYNVNKNTFESFVNTIIDSESDSYTNFAKTRNEDTIGCIINSNNNNNNDNTPEPEKRYPVSKQEIESGMNKRRSRKNPTKSEINRNQTMPDGLPSSAPYCGVYYTTSIFDESETKGQNRNLSEIQSVCTNMESESSKGVPCWDKTNVDFANIVTYVPGTNHSEFNIGIELIESNEGEKTTFVLDHVDVGKIKKEASDERDAANKKLSPYSGNTSANNVFTNTYSKDTLKK